MKYVLLSADNNPSVYLVPDIVADNLSKYCMEFCDKWLYESSHAKKYSIGGGVCYNESDFIEYLNTWVFPSKQSIMIETIARDEEIPPQYQCCEWFNF
jgi:hypothetical protein